MANVVVTGAAGRMGIQIIRMVKEAPGLALTGSLGTSSTTFSPL